MNKVLFAVGLLSTGLALGQTTGSSSTSATTSTSNYNTTNTNNENSRNATMGTNGSTDRPSSMSGNSGRRRGGNNSNMRSTTTTSGSSTMPGSSTTPGTSYNSTGTDNYNTGSNTGMTGTGTGSSTTNTSTTGSYNSNGSGGSTTTTGTTNTGMAGSANADNTTTTTTGSSDMNSVGAGSSMTTPSSVGNTGTSVTTNSTYSTSTSTARPYQTKDYKNFAYGIYVGLNTTKFKGEALDANGAATALTGRLGYQLGFFVRGGGRLYGQIGAEYFASSSNYFTAGSGQTVKSINDQINIKYIQVPVYVGYKLTQSDRGISSVRVQVGLEYANQIGSTANQFGNLNNFEVKGGTFNGLGQLGFDAGPVFLDLTYHYGFSNAIQQNAGFAGSQRRILSASLGFKF